jgi:hypothetical protein
MTRRGEAQNRPPNPAFLRLSIPCDPISPSATRWINLGAIEEKRPSRPLPKAFIRDPKDRRDARLSAVARLSRRHPPVAPGGRRGADRIA